MKKLLITGITVLSLVFAASAQQAGSLPQVAVTPDHPLYDVKMEIEEQIVELSQTNKSKAEAKLERARTRLAEIETLVNNNKTELANEAAQNYTETMKDLRNLGEQLSQNKSREIEEMVANATSFHIEVLSRVYEKVPQQAQSGIANALNKTGKIPGHLNVNVTSKLPKGLQGKMGMPSKIPGGKKNMTGRQGGNPRSSP
ncbi:MAG: DUF5667 domain-containing protein [Candidatus Nanohaloarchaea archaeon]